MAREVAKGIKAPKKETVARTAGDTVTAEGDELANLEGYTGPDGSKSLGYLKHPPSVDNSGLGADADDAGRTRQLPGQNSGAGRSIQAQEGAGTEEGRVESARMAERSR